eukprot:GDKH01004276.1.p1 GENE.GDKH01004276.1~~GDKH01004276.1.p1  ORF type:complete len:88 (+),score=10.22 GDKH01004276.1:156-419(+)
MVSFTCESCHEVLKKNKIDKHCQTKCRSAWYFTCIDCSKTFEGFAYAEHNSCMTEEERYWGQFAKGKKPAASAPTTAASSPTPPAEP